MSASQQTEADTNWMFLDANLIYTWSKWAQVAWKSGAHSLFFFSFFRLASAILFSLFYSWTIWRFSFITKVMDWAITALLLPLQSDSFQAKHKNLKTYFDENHNSNYNVTLLGKNAFRILRPLFCATIHWNVKYWQVNLTKILPGELRAAGSPLPHDVVEKQQKHS